MNLYLFLKKGDQDPDPIANPDKNAFMKEGMVVAYHDEAIPDHGPISSLSDHTKKVYVVVRISEAYRENAATWTLPLYDEDEVLESIFDAPTPLYKRSRTIDLQQLATDLGDPSLYEAWASGNPVEPVDATKLNFGLLRVKRSDLKDYNDTVKNPPVKDTNAITSGTYTVGSGGDYATITLFEADFGTPTGNLTGQIISDINETSTPNFNIASSFDYIIDSDTPHNGDQTAGWFVTRNINANFITKGAGGTGYLELKNFTVYSSASTGAGTRMIDCGLNSSAKFKVHDMFVDGRGRTCSLIYLRYDQDKQIYNTTVWGANISGGTGIFVNTVTGLTIENCTMYDSVIGMRMLNAAFTIENISALDNGTNFTNTANSTANNCVSSDATIPATANDSHINVTTTDEVQSTDDTNGSLFMLPKTGGNMTDGGKTPSISTEGMKGNAWNATTPSIGAFQWPAAAPAGGGSPMGNIIWWWWRKRRD